MIELSPVVRARAERMERKHADRRARIVAAAKAQFAELGLGGATMRGIADAAGFSTGAIYPYFAAKEEIYAAVLRDSLTDLNGHVAWFIEGVRERFGAAGLSGFFDYYRRHPEELALGLYLYDGVGPSGLSADLNQDLNARLRLVFDRIEDGFRRDGLDDADDRTASGCAQAIGLLLMDRTGRMRLFGSDAEALFSRFLTQRAAP